MFPKYELIITVVFIFFQISNISNYQDSLDLSESSDKLLPFSRRYTRQAQFSSCVIPNFPPHTKYKILTQKGPRYTKSGNVVPNYATVAIGCGMGFKLNPLVQNYSVCINGIWTPSLTTCLRACPSLTSITSTNVKCKFGVRPLDNCYDPVEATTVLVSCNSLHEDSNIDNNPSHICSDGRWEPSITQCHANCGQKRPMGQTNIINGADTVHGDYPWHIGIYNASDQGYLCGGAIIERNIILSAAHCFADYDGNVFPRENYLIAGGKYYREYGHASDIHAQYSKIRSINIPERYRGLTTLQALDIAVIILEDPFTISIALQPVCIELNEQLQHLHLSSNSIGVVTGWGYRQEGHDLAEVLREVQIPYIPYDKCYDEVPMSFKQYLNQDKICGGYRASGTSICTGDSGGALVFNNILTDRFYIKGVVSTSPATIKLECDSNQYSLFTSVTAHVKFIRNVITRNRLPDYVVCKYDKCGSEAPEEIPDEVPEEETVDTSENYDKCCAQGSSCSYFYFRCVQHRTLFKRMVDIML